MEFFTQAVDVLKVLVMAVGAGVGAWGVINLMEGYGNDNHGAKSQGVKRYRPYRLKTDSASCQCTKVGRKGVMKCLGYSTR